MIEVLFCEYAHKSDLMKRITLAVSMLLLPYILMGQKRKSYIEIVPYYQYDSYPEFTYGGGPPTTQFVKIKGNSLGANAYYKTPVGRYLYVKFGVGYYRYSFNKMDNHTVTFGPNHSRGISYPSDLYVNYWTDKYWYNTALADVGIQRVIPLDKTMNLTAGVDFQNFFTFSQYYRITASYPTGPPNHRFTTKERRYFGFTAKLYAGMLFKIGRISIGPEVFVPLFSLWKQDVIFGEDNSASRDKWIRGIGAGISCSYSI